MDSGINILYVDSLNNSYDVDNNELSRYIRNIIQFALIGNLHLLALNFHLYTIEKAIALTGIEEMECFEKKK